MELDTVVCGDCLDVMKDIPDEYIDLIYIDPPYYMQQNFYTKDGRLAFNDKWESLEAYLAYLGVRIREMKRLLKPTGSIFVHLDWHASHYVKVEMDKIFGVDNFRNEIIWSYRTGGTSKHYFSRKHDVLLFYSKTDRWKFNLLKVKTYIPTLANRTFAIEKLGAKIDDDGCPKCGLKGQWYKLSLMRDVWEVQPLFRNSRERIGYPTQKPEALVERVVEAASNEGDVVADFFCGGGTTPAVAQRLNRRWIACDQSEIAVEIANTRIEKARLEMAQLSFLSEQKEL